MICKFVGLTLQSDRIKELLKNKLHSKYFFTGVLALVFLTRLLLFLFVYFNDPERFMLHDSYGYAQIAENIRYAGEYSQSETAPFFPDVFRPPIYPLFIAVVEFSGGDLGLLIFMQIVFALLTCYILMRCIVLLLGEQHVNTAYLAGLLYALDVPSLVMGNLVMTENLFTLLLLLFLFHFIRFYRNHKSSSLIYAGIFLALATLTRPITLYLPWFILLMLVLQYRKKALPYVLAFAIPVLLLSGSWYIRNYIQHDRFYFSQIGNFNLLYFQAADIYAKKNNATLNEARDVLYREVQLSMKEIPKENPLDFYNLCGQKAKRIILQHPVEAAKNMLRAQVNLWFRPLRGYLDYQLFNSDVYAAISIFPSETTGNIISKPAHPLTRILLYWQLLMQPLLILLMLMGCRICYKHQPAVFVFFSVVLIYFALVCSGPEIDARFRVPLLPLLLLLASFSLAALRRQIPETQR